MDSMTTLMILAAALAVTMAAPCNQTCTGVCDQWSQTCRFLPINIPDVCQKVSQTCVGVCSLVCTCGDTCGIQCGAELDACRAGKTDLLDNCSASLTTCLPKCLGQCAMSTAGALYQQAAGYVQSLIMDYQGGAGK
ncbi:uncharacterized protein LOC131936927 [Physella acuta]|uniref:uncharacterized protein LOC131936927 n=1 Tax=Physella acuta TaxID=109671 RepID=UPI0027DAD167|nr:uncharacterized protein LOC131936927 [Physella acuta]